MFCTKCGKEIDETMKFCLNCGTENNMVENEKINEKPKKKSSKKGLFIILAIIIAIIGVIFLKTRYTIYEIGETAKLKDFNFTLLDVEYGKNIELRTNSSDFHLPMLPPRRPKACEFGDTACCVRATMPMQPLPIRLAKMLPALLSGTPMFAPWHPLFPTFTGTTMLLTEPVRPT